jgi:hypothetical protein
MSGQSDPLEPTVKAGVSSNLGEAVVKLSGSLQVGNAIVVSLTWARSRAGEPGTYRIIFANQQK